MYGHKQKEMAGDAKVRFGHTCFGPNVGINSRRVQTQVYKFGDLAGFVRAKQGPAKELQNILSVCHDFIP